MRCKHILLGLTVAATASGCTSLSESIKERATVSEECRDTLATPPLHIEEHTKIASIFVGNVGRCDLVQDETLLPMCALAQIRTTHGIAPLLDPALLSSGFADLEAAMSRAKDMLPAPETLDTKSKRGAAIQSLYASFDALSSTIHEQPERTTIWRYLNELRDAEIRVGKALPADALPAPQPALEILRKSTNEFALSLVPVLGQPELRPYLDVFDRAVFDLRARMTDLAENVRTLDDKYKEVLATLKVDEIKPRPAYAARTAAMQQANDEADKLRQLVANVREAHRATRFAAQALIAKLPQQARAELIAWDNNLRIQLDQLEQLLSGNFNVVFNAGVRDEVLTHVARRSLELLHGALKPADAVISRLDDKAYGAVSVSYLAFGPNIQKAVNDSYDKLALVYRDRQDPAKDQAKRKEATETFLRELKRAACDNLTQGTQFSMLSELVDTMLIMRVDAKNPSVAPPPPTPDQNILSTSAAVFPSLPETSRPPLRKAGFVMGRAAASHEEAASQPVADQTATVTPLSVYVVNEWMARQQLLTEKISASLANPPKTGSAKPVQLPDVETVDEGLVKQIADAATAKAIDDAARLDPRMLDDSPAGVSSNIRNSINVVSAAKAVSYASAVLNANISVSNVNTFSPTNSNIFSPVITVAAPAALSPCTAIDFGAVGISCTDNGGNLMLGFSSRHFRSDSCMPDDLEPALTAMGNLLKSYRARSGIGYRAAVDGYASLPTARLGRCPRTAPEPARMCNYVNGMRQSISIVGCEDKHADRNVVLSAQRARVAADALELAADGAVVVDRLQAFGSDTAAKRGAGAPLSIDQAVVVRLTPSVAP